MEGKQVSTKKKQRFGSLTAGVLWGQQFVRCIGIDGGKAEDGGDVINSIIINYESVNGGPAQTTELDPDEYINSVLIKGRNITYENLSWETICHLELTTNKGKKFAFGNGQGNELAKLENIRVISIGGRSGQWLHQLELVWVENYSPSTSLGKANCIIDFTKPGTKKTIYQEEKLKTFNSFEKVTSHMESVKISASVEAEYFAKVSLSTELNFEDSTTKTIKESLEKELKKSTKLTENIPLGQVSVTVIECDIMSVSGGNSWMCPVNSNRQEILIDIHDEKAVNALIGTYDLTSSLSLQVPMLHAETVDGFTKFVKQ